MSYREMLESGAGAGRARAVVVVRAPLAEVAKLCCAFETLHEWHPAFARTIDVEGDGVGAVRTIDMGGTPVRERLEHLADDGLGYFYSVIAHPLVPAGARGFVEARAGADEDTSVLEYALAFEADGGLVPAQMVTGLVKGLCDMGVGAAKVRLEGGGGAWPDDEVTIPDSLRANRS